MPVHRGVLVACVSLFAACWLPACLLAGCTAEPRWKRVVLELPDALGCRPTEIDRLKLTALGDFPAKSENVLVLDPAMDLEPIERFDDESRLLTIDAVGTVGPERWAGGGIATLDAEDPRVVLLRYGRSCAMADPHAKIPEGAAVTVLPDGRLWIAGGEEEGAVLASVLVVRPTDTLATVSAARLFVERTHASASLVEDDLVVLAGGSGRAGGEGEDTFEVVSVARDARVGDGFLLEPRREHAAIALGRRVVLSGGRARPEAAPLASLEVITLDVSGSGQSERIGRLEAARAGHVMLSLDDGSVAIAGGVDESGAPVALVERFDPALEAVSVLGRWKHARAEAAHVALPGGRIAQVGGREGEGWSGDLELLLENGDAISIENVIPPLERPVAAAAAGGRVLVIGRDPTSGRPRGVLLDPDSDERREIEPSRAPTHLFSLADGSFAEADAHGIAALRVDLRTALDAPPASIAPGFFEDRAHLALDAPSRWQPRGAALEAAHAGARVDIPTLRFADFSLTLDASGAFDLLLVRDDAPLAIELRQDGAALGECRLSEMTEPLRVLRKAERLTFESGGRSVECSAELPERVGLAMRARERGAVIHRVELERR